MSISIKSKMNLLTALVPAVLGITLTGMVVSCRKPSSSSSGKLSGGGDTKFANRSMLIENQKVLMVTVKHAGCTYDLPGGYRKSNESPQVNAARETWEEAGVCVEAMDRISGNKDYGTYRARRVNNSRCSHFSRTRYENCGKNGAPEWVSLSKLEQIRNRLRGSVSYKVLKAQLQKSRSGFDYISYAPPAPVSNDINQLLQKIKGKYVVAFDVDNTLLDWNTGYAEYNRGKDKAAPYAAAALSQVKANIGSIYICSAHSRKTEQVGTLKKVFRNELGNFNFNEPNYYYGYGNKRSCVEKIADASGKKVIFFDDNRKHKGEAESGGAIFGAVDGGPGLTIEAFRSGLQIAVRNLSYSNPSISSTSMIEKRPYDGKSCEQHKAWGNCGKDFMIREGACKVTCGSLAPAIEKRPYDGKSCEQHKAWGNCGKDFMIREGACKVTCGSLAPAIEKRPYDGKSCEQHKAWGNCGKDFMIREGACEVTCAGSVPADKEGEIRPWDGEACYKHKVWGNCGKDFMIREGACKITCGS